MPPSGHSLLHEASKVHPITQQEPLLGTLTDSAFTKPSARGIASPIHRRDLLFCEGTASESVLSVGVRAGPSAKSKALPYAKASPVSNTRFLA